MLSAGSLNLLVAPGHVKSSELLWNLSVTGHLRVELNRTIHSLMFISVKVKWLTRKLDQVCNKACLSVTENLCVCVYTVYHFPFHMCILVNLLTLSLFIDNCKPPFCLDQKNV